MSTFFKHIRVLDASNKVAPNGGITLAAKFDEENKKWLFAAAYCNPKDLFCKRIGRVKAEGRLKSEAWHLELDQQFTDKIKTHDLLNQVAFILAEDYNTFQTNLNAARGKAVNRVHFGIPYKGQVHELTH